MSLTTQYAPSKQAGNGVAVIFNFSFKVIAATDVVVTIFNAANVQGPPLVLGVDYTLNFNTYNQNGFVTMTVPVPNGSFINIALCRAIYSRSPAEARRRVPDKTTETALDLLTALIQELQGTVAAITVVNTPILVGTDVAILALVAAAPTIPILAALTTSRTIQLYLGNASLGTNGWANLGGF